MLHAPRPEPSATLLERIIAQTSGMVDGNVGTPAGELATSTSFGAKILPFRNRVVSAFRRPVGQSFLQPRLAMTAAMAFFSIALTLNLTGVRLSAVRLSDLRPTSIKRGFYAANAGVVRYYDNLSVVYQLESSVRDMQRDWDTTPANQPKAPAPEQPAPDQQQKEKPKQPNPGSSYRESLRPARRDDASDRSSHHTNDNTTRLIAEPILTAALPIDDHAQQMNQLGVSL
jgi:hypothetical protein